MTKQEIEALQIGDVIIYKNAYNYKASHIIEHRNLKFINLRCTEVTSYERNYYNYYNTIVYSIRMCYQISCLLSNNWTLNKLDDSIYSKLQYLLNQNHDS